MLSRVFDMFTQVESAAPRARGGLGIGLMLVRSLVRMHGGTAVAHSDGAGRGSEFVVTLPLAAAAASRADGPRAPRPMGLSGESDVLVVDDNRDAADSLGTLLTFCGARVRVVHDGRSALDAVEAAKPSVVLLDIGMPGMDGLEVAQRIRGDRRFDDVTLVALSGWGQEEDRRRSKAAGFDHHLVKPAAIEDLRRVLTPARTARLELLPPVSGSGNGRAAG
jgi:CheY-like chemotaxis protein